MSEHLAKGCHRSHPHEAMNEICKLKARRAELEAVARKLAFDLGHRDTDWKCCLEESTGSIEIIIQVFQQIEREALEAAAQIVERHGSHPVKHDELMSAWVATPFYEKSKEIAKQIRQQNEGR
jgi:hypothetical protein